MSDNIVIPKQPISDTKIGIRAINIPNIKLILLIIFFGIISSSSMFKFYHIANILSNINIPQKTI